jgi:uncharacterized membrane protein
MTTSHADEREARGFERFLFFSDAIAAIAITLLILPLVDAVTDAGSDALTVADILQEINWEVFSFLLSFGVILTLWFSHQQIYNGVRTVTSPMMWLGAAWLLAVVFLPFTTALIADHSDEQLTLILYIANVALAIHAMTITTWMLKHRPELLHAGDDIDNDELAASIRTSILITAALVTAIIFPSVGFLVMGVLALDTPLRKLMERLADR